MKKSILFLSLFIITILLLAPCISSISIINQRKMPQFIDKIDKHQGAFKNQLSIKTVDTLLNREDFTDTSRFSPGDIELKDDAFHGSNSLHFTEWWYFDAFLNDGYSLEISIHIAKVVNQGFSMVGLHLYKDSKPLINERKVILLDDFFASEEIPLIEIYGKPIMKGYIDEKTGSWIYDLEILLNKIEIELTFIGCTSGWKGITSAGGWGVILPDSIVNGVITFDNNKFEVTGRGYHDHNWDVTIFSSLNFGWLWGKIKSENISLTWSSILTTRFLDKQILVINKKNDGYLNVDPEDFQLVINDIRFKNGMLIPTSFTLSMYKNDVSLYVEMEVIETHHIWLVSVNYWRYHLKCSGYISYDDNTEMIDNIQIAEFIRFR